MGQFHFHPDQYLELMHSEMPSRADEQVTWLREAGLDASVIWAEGDLAVLCASR